MMVPIIFFFFFEILTNFFLKKKMSKRQRTFGDKGTAKRIKGDCDAESSNDEHEYSTSASSTSSASSAPETTRAWIERSREGKNVEKMMPLDDAVALQEEHEAAVKELCCISEKIRSLLDVEGVRDHIGSRNVAVFSRVCETT